MVNITLEIKSLIQAMVNSLGYEIRKLPKWQASFQKAVSKVRGTTLVTDDRCYMIYILCLNCVHLQGDFAECGVYKGGTAFLIADTIKESADGRQLHLFDTFTGMPDTAIEGIDVHKAGGFADTSLNSVKRYLSRFPFVVFHPGFIPDTFSGVKDKSFSFIHVDVDIYQSALDCCEFFYQRMVKGGVMVFDDYGFPECKGEQKAVDEFFMDKKERPIVLPTGQCLVIKL